VSPVSPRSAGAPGCVSNADAVGVGAGAGTLCMAWASAVWPARVTLGSGWRPIGSPWMCREVWSAVLPVSPPGGCYAPPPHPPSAVREGTR
jgi:hypothetical protein